MASINIQTKYLIDNIGDRNKPNSARGCINELRDAFNKIKDTSQKLNDVWDDDAQKIFMDSFYMKYVVVMRYLTDLDNLLSEFIVFTNRVTDWDNNLLQRLSDQNFGG